MLETLIFGKVISQDRFILLQRILHLNDNLNLCPRDRLVMIDTVIETLRKHFKSIFIPYQKLCIDESIVEWKGRLLFKQYIPSKNTGLELNYLFYVIEVRFCLRLFSLY